MDSKEFWGAVFAGVVIGFVLCAAVASLPGSKINIYDRAKEQCERSLPRDQHCVIVAVPEAKK